MTHFLLISSLNECLSLVRLVLHRLPPSALKFSCSIPELYPLLDPKVCRELSDSHTVDQSELVPEWVLGLRDEDLQEEIIKRLVTACEKDNKSTVLFLLRALWAALWRLYGISQVKRVAIIKVFCKGGNFPSGLSQEGFGGGGGGGGAWFIDLTLSKVKFSLLSDNGRVCDGRSLLCSRAFM